MNLPEPVHSRMRGVFEKYPEVLAVYLFGSRAEGNARPDSDYDLAVVPVQGLSARSRQMDILTDLARAGFENIDLSFLDHDNLVLSHEAVRMNFIIFCRPEFDHGSYYSRIVRLYFDFRPCLDIQRAALKERLTHGAA